jgi:hypothetical protein
MPDLATIIYRIKEHPFMLFIYVASAVITICLLIWNILQPNWAGPTIVFILLLVARELLAPADKRKEIVAENTRLTNENDGLRNEVAKLNEAISQATQRKPERKPLAVMAAEANAPPYEPSGLTLEILKLYRARGVDVLSDEYMCSSTGADRLEVSAAITDLKVHGFVESHSIGKGIMNWQLTPKGTKFVVARWVRDK